jgi:hypothetical protein
MKYATANDDTPVLISNSVRLFSLEVVVERHVSEPHAFVIKARDTRYQRARRANLADALELLGLDLPDNVETTGNRYSVAPILLDRLKGGNKVAHLLYEAAAVLPSFDLPYPEDDDVDDDAA